MPTSSAARITMALKAMFVIFAMVGFVATYVAVVGFAKDYKFGTEGMSFPSPVQYQTVQLSPHFSVSSYYACRHIHPDNVDFQQLCGNRPSRTLPLKVSYAARYVHSKPTPTPPPTTHKGAPTSITPSHRASTLASVLTLTSGTPWAMMRVIVGLFFCMATAAHLMPRLNPFKKCLQLPTMTKETLGKIMAIILVYFSNSEALPSTGMHNPKPNSMPNLESEEQRNVHADNMTAFYEDYLFATADMAPRFGPSIQNAENEFRRYLAGVEGNIGKQADIASFFRKTLDAFTRELVAAEATSEGCNTRYLTIIEDQDRLIDELRLLHEYREQAFRDNEDLVKSLCRYKKDGELIIPVGDERIYPFNKYSAEYDKFIISPRDSLASSSMKVSVQKAPFDRRPVTILHSDPHWQRFSELVAKKEAEQEARLASYKDDLNECDEKEEEDVRDGCSQGICDDSQSSGDDCLEKTEVGNEVGVDDIEPPNEALMEAKNNLIWYEWKLACMKGSQRLPRDSDSPQSSDIPPAITARVTDGTAYARLA